MIWKGDLRSLVSIATVYTVMLLIWYVFPGNETKCKLYPVMHKFSCKLFETDTLLYVCARIASDSATLHSDWPPLMYCLWHATLYVNNGLLIFV